MIGEGPGKVKVVVDDSDGRYSGQSCQVPAVNMLESCVGVGGSASHKNASRVILKNWNRSRVPVQFSY